MRTQIIAECASNHGGSPELITDMITAAADYGADFVKFQVYDTVNLSPDDPQREWLAKAQLTDSLLNLIADEAKQQRIKLMFSVFDQASAARVYKYTSYLKIGHGSLDAKILQHSEKWWFVSLPWGKARQDYPPEDYRRLSVIPLYPAPLHTLSAVTLLEGYSDHTVGNIACIWALAHHVQYIEKHFSLSGRGRNSPWDMRPGQLAELRKQTDLFASIHSGVEDYGRWGQRHNRVC